MKDFGSEPRIAIPNSASYGYAYVVEDPYFDAYSALAAVRDGLIAIEGGLEIGDDGEDTLGLDSRLGGWLRSSIWDLEAIFVDGGAHLLPTRPKAL